MKRPADEKAERLNWLPSAIEADRQDLRYRVLVAIVPAVPVAAAPVTYVDAHARAIPIALDVSTMAPAIAPLAPPKSNLVHSGRGAPVLKTSHATCRCG